MVVAFVGLLSLNIAHAAWQIVTPTKPIQSLVMGVVGDTANVGVIVSGTKTPHGFQLKPSHIRQLHQADWVIRLHPDAERYLNKAMQAVPPQKITFLTQQISLPIFQKRKGVDWASHDHHHEHEHKDYGLNQDFHVWLNPVYAMSMVKVIQQEASERQPQFSEQFKQNAEIMLSKLKALDITLQQQLSDVKDKPYWVFHDAYQYFEKRYELNAQGAIRIEPNMSPSVKRMREIQSQLKANEAVCVFAEPQFSERMVAGLVRGTEIKTGRLDPLGVAFESSAEQYFKLMQTLSDSLKHCLN